MTREADVDPDVFAMARRHLAEHDTVDLLARKCLHLIDPMCPSLADKGDSAEMYRDLARRAIRQALAPESQAEGEAGSGVPLIRVGLDGHSLYQDAPAGPQAEGAGETAGGAS